jgi:predicted AAA+ superfamily ATPase
MYRRYLIQAVEAALTDTRVVLVNGARQVGKSTLAQELVARRSGQYLTLDDPAVAAAARADPTALVQAAGDFTVFDEVQQAPGLFAALKRAVDADPRPGRFLLTGSANVLMLPRIAESLAGRMQVLTLQPLTQSEIADTGHNLVDALFDPGAWVARRVPTDRADLARRIVTGGFPEALARADATRRAAWFGSYLTSLLQRDVRDLANIEALHDLPRLLGLLAARNAALLNAAEVSRAVRLADTTLRRYLALLEAAFIIQPLPAWSNNLGKRLVKAAKLHLVDTGLAAHLQGEIEPAALAASLRMGPLLESFVVQELRRQLGWSSTRASAWHYRTASGREVDLVLEAADGQIVGVEVKGSASVSASDTAGLSSLAETAGRRFVRGVVLYCGEQLLPLARDVWAVPISVLWA